MSGLTRSATLGASLLVLIVSVMSTRILADNCDQKCRARTNFYVCPDDHGAIPQYWYYQDADCFMCYQFAGLNGGGFCEKDGLHPVETCIESGTTKRVAYEDGTQRCTCDQKNVKWFIEAAPKTINLDDGKKCERHVCGIE